jgi:glycerophosphoryl diester phosphodiesterase
LNVAHRGARAFAPENTLEAFEKAAALGADAVELDVQLSSDDELVVVHDESLERCSDIRLRYPGRRDYAVRSLTLDEIQTLDAGSWFVQALETEPARRPAFLQPLSDDEARRFIAPADRAHYRSGQVHHPTLEQALRRIDQLGLRVNVELKPARLPADALHLAERAVRLIEHMSLGDRVLVSSFDHDCLRRAKAIQPAIAIGVLVEQPLADSVGYCRELQASAYHPGCYDEWDAVGFGSAEFRQSGRLPSGPIRSLRAADIDVYVWTENDPKRMPCLIEAGVSGIFTDYPNRLAQVLRA